MDLWVAIVSPEKKFYEPDGSGDIFKNFKYIIRQLFFSGSYDSFAKLKAEHEQNPNTRVYQLTETVYNNLTGDLAIDAYTDIPKWQINDSNEEIGSYTDPEDTQSTWQVNTPIEDYRYQLKIRHNATFIDGENTKPTISDNFPSKIILDQYDKTTGEPNNKVVVGIELFNKIGNKMNYTQEGEVFYNGNTPTVVDFVSGFAEVYIKTDEPTKKQVFRSNHIYRVDQPTREIIIVIRSRTLND